LLRIDEVEQRFLAAIKIHSTHGNRDHLRARSFYRPARLFPAAVFAGADDEARLELTSGNDERIHGFIVNGQRTCLSIVESIGFLVALLLGMTIRFAIPGVTSESLLVELYFFPYSRYCCRFC